VNQALDVYGADLALEYLLNDNWSVAGTYSWVSEDFFPEVFSSGTEQLALNAPDNKASLTLGFRDEDRGFKAEVRGRYTNAFPVSSGVYQGSVPVNALMDFTATYRIPGQRNMLFSAMVTNVFDNKRPTFVGVPDIGRLVMGRLQVSF
jgi:iron complex outermembrane receptor protein